MATFGYVTLAFIAGVVLAFLLVAIASSWRCQHKWRSIAVNVDMVYVRDNSPAGQGSVAIYRCDLCPASRAFTYSGPGKKEIEVEYAKIFFKNELLAQLFPASAPATKESADGR